MTQSFTILLPVINETKSLIKTIEIIESRSKDENLNYLFLCDKNKSSKESIDICNEYVNKNKLKFRTIFQKKKGIGGAFIDSFGNISTTHTIMMASDLETDPKTVSELINISKENIDTIICTSRWINKNSFYEYGFFKKKLNYLFQKFFSLLFQVKLSDLTFGFRLYPTDILKKIDWEINNFGFLFESIMKPVHYGYSTLEIATNWRKRKEGKSSNSFKYYISYFYIAYRIKISSKSR